MIQIESNRKKIGNYIKDKESKWEYKGQKAYHIERESFFNLLESFPQPEVIEEASNSVEGSVSQNQSQKRIKEQMLKPKSDSQ